MFRLQDPINRKIAAQERHVCREICSASYYDEDRENTRQLMFMLLITIG